VVFALVPGSNLACLVLARIIRKKLNKHADSEPNANPTSDAEGDATEPDPPWTMAAWCKKDARLVIGLPCAIVER
jgi:hypothetical protein